MDAGSDGAMRAFGKINCIGSVRRCNFYLISSIAKKVMDFRVATELTSTIKSNSTSSVIWLVVGDERREKVDGRLFIATNRCAHRAILTVGDDHIAGLAIDPECSFILLGFIGEFLHSWHWDIIRSVIVLFMESSGYRCIVVRAQCYVTHFGPMPVAEEIEACGTFNHLVGLIYKELGEWFPTVFFGGPQNLEAERLSSYFLSVLDKGP